MSGLWRSLPAISESSLVPAIVIGLLPALQPAARAEPPVVPQSRSLFVGAGLLMLNAFGEVSSSETGETNSLGTGYPALSLGWRFGGERYRAAPSFNFTPLGRADSDLGTTTRIFALGLPLEAVSSRWSFRFGPGLMLKWMSGGGGQTTLNNGESYQTYWLPSGSSTSKLFYLQTGAGYDLNAYNLRLDLDLVLTGPLGDRRAGSLLFTLNHGFL